ncbi:hypothetical protein AUEXF2481DRAFT_45178 [Aureobasidium subglaciale EXF-2481]|uniref:Uncharacterized protein n=1 Tax=Aureobasidium subglaciale (strain EXF-2481) TaxID=1043005 RepID=A0A074Y325_AURSE|nr:uncharacterized protein AUEXF2481DRAFT_45178 [Aureobasidium subglaciale EXF-2481]KEQ90354.1 hypothetical protein AUEXF2481DRAFT_45178 [Aureobasidium subglaciale EXF-2481]
MPTSATLLRTLKSHCEEVGHFKLSPNAQLLASADNRDLRLRDVTTGGLVFATDAHGELIFNIAFSPDSKRIATVGSEGYARIWNTDSAQEQCALSVDGEPMLALAFSPDGKLLATASEVVRLWNPDTGLLLHTRLGPGDHNFLSPEAVWHRDEYPNEIGQVRFSPDGQTLVSTCHSTNTTRL